MPHPPSYSIFLRKFLICSFVYGIREKSTGEMHPDQNPQSQMRFAGFCVWGRMKEVIRMRRQRNRQGGGVIRRIWGGGWRSHYGGNLHED
ncbi:hypothetical protein ACFOY8_22780 [Thalassospira xianhensis]|uniref:hypothetical protein n=1 Tax=Thalassospira xianhensis TaxID=478503 RepID=UPI00362323BA